jgi:hypothetical protein
MRMNDVRTKFLHNAPYSSRGDVRQPDSEIRMDGEPYTRDAMDHYARGMARLSCRCNNINLMTTASESLGELLSEYSSAVNFRWIGFDADK